MGRSSKLDRCSYIGGSDARTVMGHDEAALLRLWQEKRGEIDPEDLSTNLAVQLGLATEELNRRWFERETWTAARKCSEIRAPSQARLDGSDARRNGQGGDRRLRSEVHASLVVHRKKRGREAHAAAAAQHARGWRAKGLSLDPDRRGQMGLDRGRGRPGLPDGAAAGRTHLLALRENRRNAQRLRG